MKKFSQFIWNLYKESADGQEAISMFRAAYSPTCTAEQLLSLAKKYDERLFINSGVDNDEEEIAYLNENIAFLGRALSVESKTLIASSDQEKELFFQWLMKGNVGIEPESSFEDIPQNVFKSALFELILTSWAVYKELPKAFIPNLFAFQFHYLVRFAQQYEIDLPHVPSRSAYKDRCWYYVELNKILLEFAHQNDITKPEEVCAFWFGLALPLAKESIEEDRKELPQIPENAWLLVGNYGTAEKNMTEGFWQANPMTSRGDVMIFYEKSPVMKVNSVWRALDDGVADPFFLRYGYTMIGQKINIPEDQVISFQDFKDSKYFQERESKGNFVSKNFQDCSGWPVSFNDYAEIKRMLKDKGFDSNVLPSLYEPKDFSAETITSEDDVYEKLVTPLLEQMGWQKGKDFEREVEFAAGHTTTHHVSNKRPDYCLHITRKGKKVSAKVVIEAKEFFKNTTQLAECFDQCETYANWGKAKVLVICDKFSIYVYEQDRNGLFDKDHHKTRFRWTELSNHDKFIELKRKLDI